MTTETKKPYFLDTPKDELQAFFQTHQIPSYRMKQIDEWIFKKFTYDPNLMSNLPQKFRDALLENFDWELPSIVSRLDAKDGATKLLLKSRTGHNIEAVILRYDGRTSLCISSQVGCKLACAFCQTGKLGFVRHLSAAELVAQFLSAYAITSTEDRRLSHIVFMGMGEPFDNYNATVMAARYFTAPEYYGLSKRHVTISTSGLVPQIKMLADDPVGSLAVSLHACRDELRTELMPINRKYNLTQLKEALLYYQKKTGAMITLEYILIKDKNCGQREARELIRFIHGLRAKVNLIPFNSHPGLPFEHPTEHEIKSFQSYLSQRSVPAPVRYSKGLEVSAACGQLAAKHLDDLNNAPKRQAVLP